MEGEHKSKEASEALGRSSGGWTGTIHCALNGQRLPTSFYVSAGEVMMVNRACYCCSTNVLSMYWVRVGIQVRNDEII